MLLGFVSLQHLVARHTIQYLYYTIFKRFFFFFFFAIFFSYTRFHHDGCQLAALGIEDAT